MQLIQSYPSIVINPINRLYLMSAIDNFLMHKLYTDTHQNETFNHMEWGLEWKCLTDSTSAHVAVKPFCASHRKYHNFCVAIVVTTLPVLRNIYCNPNSVDFQLSFCLSSLWLSIPSESHNHLLLVNYMPVIHLKHPYNWWEKLTCLRVALY